jgi:hypothetical protein
MNGIVRITNKPLNIIDTLRSELAKEARRLSEALQSPSLATLAENVAAAEVTVATPEYRALVGALKAALAPASVEDVTRELGLLFACYPAKDIDISVLVACAVDEVIREQPSKLRLLVSGRRTRRKCKFRPTIADIIEALDDAYKAVVKAKQIIDFPKRLDEAASRLHGLVQLEMRHVTKLLSDRLRRLDMEKDVSGVDYNLKEVRDKLANVLAHRVAALEPLRPLIVQRTTITENEKFLTRWW